MLSVIELPVGGKPFSKLLRESGKISSEILPKLKYKSPPLWGVFGFTFSAS